MRTSNFSEFLDAWDEYSIHPDDLRGSPHSLQPEDRDEFAKHALQALEVFKLSQKHGPRSLSVYLEERRYPAFATDLTLSIEGANKSAASGFGVKLGDEISQLGVGPDCIDKLRKAILEFRLNPGNLRNRIVPVKAYLQGDRFHMLMAEFIHPDDRILERSSAAIIFKSYIADWNGKSEDIIRTTFKLSPTELAILKELYLGCSAREIASSRQRSVQTVQKQVKSILHKVGVGTQIDLIRLISGMINICGKSIASQESVFQNWRRGQVFQRLREAKLKNGQKLHYLHYGRAGGMLAIMWHGNTSPYVPRQFVEAIADHGLQIFAPFHQQVSRKGLETGASDRRSLISLHRGFVKALGFDRYFLIGQAMAGIQCLEIAAQLPSHVKGVVLLDTGAPIREVGELSEIPPTSQRTFKGIFETPELVLASYVFAGDLFFSGEQGRQSIMKLTYADSALDTELLKQPSIAAHVEENLRTILTDPEQVVQDLKLWMSDWTSLLGKAEQHCPVLFVNGAKHDWLLADRIISACKARTNTKYALIPNTAQLALYQAPDKVAEAISRVTSL